MTLSTKYKKTQLHIDILLHCRKIDLLLTLIQNIKENLNHFTFFSNKVTNKYERWLLMAQVKLLNLEIKDHYFKINDIRHNILGTGKWLEDNLQTEVVQEFYLTQIIRLKDLENKIYNKKSKKLDNLFAEKYKGADVNEDNRWFENLTQHFYTATS